MSYDKRWRIGVALTSVSYIGLLIHDLIKFN